MKLSAGESRAALWGEHPLLRHRVKWYDGQSLCPGASPTLFNRRLPRPSGTPFFGWRVVTSAGVLLAFNTLVFQIGFGAYFVHLQNDFGWSRTILAGSYSVSQVVVGVMGPMQGWLIDRFGPRSIARLGVVIFGLGSMYLSFIDSIVGFYLSFFVIAVGSSLVGWVTLNVAVARWFARRRATAMGLVSVGGSIGGLLLPLLALSMDTYGWRVTAFAMGVLILVAGLPLVQMLRSRPQDYGQVPDGGYRQASSLSGEAAPDPIDPATAGPAGGDFTAREAVRTPAFWLISLGHAFAVLVVVAVNVHLISHLVDRLGISVQVASLMFSLMVGFTVIGQVLGGFLADRFDKRRLAAVGMLGHVAGLLVVAFATNLGWVVLFAVLHGLAWGVRGPVMTSIRADYFGTKALGTILGLGAVVLMISNVGGPIVAASLGDLTGDLRLGFSVLAIVASIGILFFLGAHKPVKPTAPAAGNAVEGHKGVV